ncbi:MAG: HNH endonuclease [Rhodospirillales bacterium]|nr:HNH endonuclease [Rhodospirillales bacterium]
MSKAVLVSNPESIYDDLPWKHYHYPQLYSSRVQQAKGDWIIYYESGSRGGRKAYFATAQIAEIVPDKQRRDHFYAIVAKGSYRQFPNPVPWRHELGYWESAFGNDPRRPNPGPAQNAVRLLSDAEYEAIVGAGFAQILNPDLMGELRSPTGLEEDAESFHRPIIERLVSEPFRSAAFTKYVRAAYDSTCAATGLKLINGEGRCEIEAAHIQPVGAGHGGPDSVRNGLALSRTVHWLFDRGLISLENDGKILFASKRHFAEIERIRSMLNQDGYMRLPDNLNQRPHPQFLKYHRDIIYAPKAA